MDERDLGTALRTIWEDQAAFNTLFRKPPTTREEMMQQARDFVLYTESELHELLRTFRWKAHRKEMSKDNPAHMDDELADVFKCALSLFQICGMTPETLVAAYWRKTAVVRQRYQEEWMGQLDRPCAVVDIDNVLCDYTTGFCDWLRRRWTGWTMMPAEVCNYMMVHDVMPLQAVDEMTARLKRIQEGRLYDSAENLGISEAERQELKHLFRISGAKRHLPVYPDAPAFLASLRHQKGLQIVLLTSRPIDKYPNMQTDTLLWLQDNQLPFDFMWWAYDKTERVLDSAFRERVRLVVDDDPKHLVGFEKLGIQTYCLVRSGDRQQMDEAWRRVAAARPIDQAPLCVVTTDLNDVLRHYDTANIEAHHETHVREAKGE